MTRLPTRALVGIGLALALFLAGFVSYYASSEPDGLERVATDKGFIGSAAGHGAAGSPLAGYGVAGVDNPRLSAGLAGVAGTLVVLVTAGGLTWALRRTRQRAGQDAGDGARPPTSSG
jgi:PDGLE domain